MSNKANTKHKTLSDKSASLLTYLNNENKSFFTIEDVTKFFHKSTYSSIVKLLHDLVKRKLILRIKNGLYNIIPYEVPADQYFPNWHIIALYLMKNTDYYIGYYSALEIHNLITQPALKEQIVANKRIIPSVKKIGKIDFQFIYKKQERFFGYKKIWINDYNKIPCSDLEMTFIDCLDKPCYSGGITEISKALFQVKDRLNYNKLLDYAIKFDKQVVFKRLGFLLELLEIDTPIIEKLYKLRSNAFTLLEPVLQKQGKMQNRWQIQINMDIETIKSGLYT